MYIPASFRVDDQRQLGDFIEQYSFATLISIRENEPFATHLPLLIDRERRVLLGHVARANPHVELIGASANALAIFSGPHAYVSPSWYETTPAVPTWNYAVVHVYGRLSAISDDETRQIVDRTVSKYESSSPEPWSYDLPQDFRERMLKGIVGFEMPIERIEGKFKLGQNRSEADQAGMLSHLQTGSSDARSLADFIRQRNDGIQR